MPIIWKGWNKLAGSTHGKVVLGGYKEIETIDNLLKQEATQLELCAALPPRSWAKIRKKITQLRGQDFTVAKPQMLMEHHEMIEQYRERHLAQGVTIDAEASARWKPQIPQNANFHRIRCLNLAKLNSNHAIRILQLNHALSD